MNPHLVHDVGPSDSESDDADTDQLYRPISSYEDDDLDELGNTDYHHIAANSSSLEYNINPNLTFFHLHAANEISALDLNGYGAGSDDEEEARVSEREASIARAFREDDRRRNAPLSSENSARILNAMRGVSFPECAPEWMDRMPEDRWLDQLRRLRGEPAS